MLKVDPKFEAAMPELNEEQAKLLRESLEKDGWWQGKYITVWKEKGVILDGHNRYRICRELKVEFDTNEMSFKSEDEAHIWVIYNQCAGRNLTALQMSDQIGRAYNLEKKPKGAQKGNPGSNQYQKKTKRGKGVEKTSSPSETKTREKVANRFNVSEKKVREDAKFSEAVEKLDKDVPGVRKQILSNKSGMTKKDVIATSKLKTKAKRKKVLDAKTKKEREKILYPTKVTAEDLKSPFTLSDQFAERIDRLGSIGSDFRVTGKDGYQYYDYKALVESDQWDSAKTVTLMTLLDDLIDEMISCRRAMFESLSEQDQERVNA